MTGRVLGIDLSMTAAGIASSAGWAQVAGEAGKRTDGYPERLARLDRQCLRVRELTGAWDQIALAVIEGPSYRSADPSAFDRAFLWWEVYSQLTASGVPVAIVTPAQRMLYATGKGMASKGAVIDAVARRWPQFETGGDDNAADAVVLLAMGLDWLGRPLTPMPQTHRRALQKVAWPDQEVSAR